MSFEINDFTVRVLDKKVGDEITVRSIDRIRKTQDKIEECYIKLFYGEIPLFIIGQDFYDVEELSAQDVVQQIYDVVDEYKRMCATDYTNDHLYYIMRNIVEVDDYTTANFRKMHIYKPLSSFVSQKVAEKRKDPTWTYNFEELYMYCMYDVVEQFKERKEEETEQAKPVMRRRRRPTA